MGQQDDNGAQRPGHADRRYKTKPCVICGQVFRPAYPQTRGCPSCTQPSCAACGESLGYIKPSRLQKKRRRVCQKCWNTRTPIGSRRPDTSHGYIWIKTEEGWEYEHRVVAAKKLGRSLRSGEVVHHIDGNPSNNSPENLVVCRSVRTHLDEHHAEVLGGRDKTHCPRGHEYSGENLRVDGRGRRHCRACDRLHAKRSRDRRR